MISDPAELKCDSGSVADPDDPYGMHWASPIRTRIHWTEIRIRILLSSSRNSKKTIDSYCFVTSLWLFIFKKCWKCTFKKSWRSLTKIAGSGSISQRYGSADPDLDPHQHFMDPQHWIPDIPEQFDCNQDIAAKLSCDFGYRIQTKNMKVNPDIAAKLECDSGFTIPATFESDSGYGNYWEVSFIFIKKIRIRNASRIYNFYLSLNHQGPALSQGIRVPVFLIGNF